ncbi:modification methylase [Anaerobacillus arseniciselenatis]|uniref:Modification methylase n=1 Tax=Anaerobacillus arseniciselenatis TaxID=85682 RepID=A0A1S2LAN9_9BACI|nr:DNA methyltransferase [Anaerobacillus arseniciselenatis]OIJ09416.1 modification methylase [Anaerobacillus arseniciselenatis]
MIDYSVHEKSYNVLYPENNNATYISQVNFSDDLQKPFQRWCRYKEGFSIELVKRLIKEQALRDSGIILDPFSGSGSTLVGANELGYKGVGFEVNPFSYFLSDVKLKAYTTEEVELFKLLYQKAIQEKNEEYLLPRLSFADKVFNDEVKSKLMEIKQNIVDYQNEGVNTKVIDLLKLGWLSAIEELSNYRKAGNGLKKRKLKKPIILTEEDVYYKLDKIYSCMYSDLISSKLKRNVSLYNDTSITMDKYVENDSVTGIIFSPPYANCFDYTEIYKLELWFGDFVSDYADLKVLRKSSLRSHLNANLKEDNENLYTIPLLEEVLNKVGEKELWDKKIPIMLRLYFHDMFRIIEKCYFALEKGGFCNIVVSNSSYGGVVVPTDLLFTIFAEKVGFEINRIEVARYIITSSQQYNITKEQKNFLRESVICLKKK